MTHSFFVGVDGGATKCVVRLEDEHGRVLGQTVGGPASLNLSVTQSLNAIFQGLNHLIKPLGLSLADKNYRWHAGMGLAGCERQENYQQFMNQPHPFETLQVSSDAHVACLGAHRGRDGAIIVTGTGSAGFQLSGGQPSKVGGWGFPHDDAGSGAWLGLYALKHTLKVWDGREQPSGLSQVIMAHFHHDETAIVTFANTANSTAFATLAPLVFMQSEAQDEAAIQLVKQAARLIDQIGEALLQKESPQGKGLPCALVGGLAPLIKPFLGEKLSARLVPCALTPEEGAIILVRQSHAKS